MQIELNGRPTEVREGTTIAEVIGLVGGDRIPEDRRGVAVALDGEVVPRSSWESTRPDEGASIEVVAAIRVAQVRTTPTGVDPGGGRGTIR